MLRLEITPRCQRAAILLRQRGVTQGQGNPGTVYLFIIAPRHRPSTPFCRRYRTCENASHRYYCKFLSIASNGSRRGNEGDEREHAAIWDGDAALALAAMASANARAQSPDRAEDEILVTADRATTATKTDTPIVQTPQAISVVTAAQIAARGAIGLQEALRYSAGVRTEPNGADYRFDYVTARGGFEAAEYIDGMRQPTSFYTSRIETYNLDRIELLRGPSSVLYGQGLRAASSTPSPSARNSPPPARSASNMAASIASRRSST